jgi:H+/Cl- antiporter ClcA
MRAVPVATTVIVTEMTGEIDSTVEIVVTEMTVEV